MLQNIIFVNGGTYCPGLPFSDHFVRPSRFLVKMFIFVLVPRNLIMSEVQRKINFAHSSHRLYVHSVHPSKHTFKNEKNGGTRQGCTVKGMHINYLIYDYKETTCKTSRKKRTI